MSFSFDCVKKIVNLSAGYHKEARVGARKYFLSRDQPACQGM
jgi:hypothetical protein